MHLSKSTRLFGAVGGVVFGIEVNDEFFAGIVSELVLLAIAPVQTEIGRSLSLLDRHKNYPFSSSSKSCLSFSSFLLVADSTRSSPNIQRSCPSIRVTSASSSITSCRQILPRLKCLRAAISSAHSSIA